ncbi:MAG: CRTAC1 family protein [Planctomycetota bacterium]
MPRNVIKLGCWLVALSTAGLLAGAAEPALPSFINATRSARLKFEHHDCHPLPGMLPQEQTRFGAGAAACDYDRDGDLDLYLVDSWGHANKLYRNNGDKTFTNVTELAGVGDLGFGHMALFVDLDNDGYDDLVVFNDATGPDPSMLSKPHYSQIYRNLGNGTFQNVSADSGFEPVARIIGGATAGDYDSDGDLDLYLVSWFDHNNYLYRNEGNFRFTDVTEEAGLRTPETFVSHWAPLFVDLNNDGTQDLFAAVDFYPDYLFFNQAGRFVLAPGVYHEGNDMGVAAADFDADGDIDLYTTNITSEWAPFPCCNWLYVNDGNGVFTNLAGDHGVRDTAWGWGTAFFDANLDGFLDLMAVNGWQQPQWETPSVFFLNDAGTFLEMTNTVGLDHVGNSRSLLPFDYDGDGDVDVLITDVYGPVTLYENITPRRDNHFLKVRLSGRQSNRNGVGARISLESDGRTQLVEITVGGSFYAGPPLEAHFGLGSSSRVDSLHIRWPSGVEQSIIDLPSDQTLSIVEPSHWDSP